MNDIKKNNISVRAALSFGWTTVKNHIALLTATGVVQFSCWIGAALALVLLNVNFIQRVAPLYEELVLLGNTAPDLTAALLKQISSVAWSYKMQLIGTFLLGLWFVAAVGTGFLRILLDLYDKGATSISRLFSCFLLAPQVLLVTVMFAVIFMLGLLLLVLPGLYLFVRLWPVVLFVIDKQAGPLEAFKLSWQATSGYSWRIGYLQLALLCIALPLNIVGRLFVFLADAPVYVVLTATLLLITAHLLLAAFGMLTWIYVYRQLVPYEVEQEDGDVDAEDIPDYDSEDDISEDDAE